MELQSYYEGRIDSGITASGWNPALIYIYIYLYIDVFFLHTCVTSRMLLHPVPS